MIRRSLNTSFGFSPLVTTETRREKREKRPEIISTSEARPVCSKNCWCANILLPSLTKICRFPNKFSQNDCEPRWPSVMEPMHRNKLSSSMQKWVQMIVIRLRHIDRHPEMMLPLECNSCLHLEAGVYLMWHEHHFHTNSLVHFSKKKKNYDRANTNWCASTMACRPFWNGPHCGCEKKPVSHAAVFQCSQV